MILITQVNGVYKPTYNLGVPHCKNMNINYIYIIIYMLRWGGAVVHFFINPSNYRGYSM